MHTTAYYYACFILGNELWTQLVLAASYPSILRLTHRKIYSLESVLWRPDPHGREVVLGSKDAKYSNLIDDVERAKAASFN